MTAIRTLHASLSSDPLRDRLPFEPEFLEYQTRLLDAPSDADRAQILSQWLQKFQPCSFGRVAAKLGQLGFCFLTPQLLDSDDEVIRDHIHQDKLRWRQRAARAEQSGFVLLALSPQLAMARPDAVLMQLAQRLSELYLRLDTAPTDDILLDSVVLEIPDRGGSHLFQWDAGVNVFAAAADGRWWQDHRIPSGLALSVNSVGHMVKSAQIVDKFKSLMEGLHVVTTEDDAPTKLRSLEDALQMAMVTISNAADAASGKATWLVDETAVDSRHCPKSIEDLPKKVAGKAQCRYRGFYHTDYTIPTLYFRDDVERPSQAPELDLDFTYLYLNSVTNVAYTRMGTGEQIRGDAGGAPRRRAKGLRQWGREVRVVDLPEDIRAALAPS